MLFPKDNIFYYTIHEPTVINYRLRVYFSYGRQHNQNTYMYWSDFVIRLFCIEIRNNESVIIIVELSKDVDVG